MGLGLLVAKPHQEKMKHLLALVLQRRPPFTQGLYRIQGPYIQLTGAVQAGLMCF
jgi:hypothetical protein